MTVKKFCFLTLLCLFNSWHGQSQSDSIVYDSPNLKIKQISQNAYIHISYLETQDFGKVACNGMLVIDKKEAVVLETPINDEVSEELMNWIEGEQIAKVKAVIAHHFHVDCLGGLNAFHQRDIPSLASELTIELAGQRGNVKPLESLEHGQLTTIGDQRLVSYFFGPAHTRDNIVSYLESEKILFGGCMVKAIGAKEGNLADADVSEWSNTIRKLRTDIPEARIVVPGHGREGGPELLDYTIELFQNR